MFGPFISDALADASKLGMREVSRASESCTSRELELEADKVSVRLMSLAGFDPRRAIDFWEDRLNDMWALDADAVRHSGAMPTGSFWSPHAPTSEKGERVHSSHPLGSERVRRLRRELDRWDKEREKLWLQQAQERTGDEF
jgi:Zn-dependent protease with chaperone function